MFYEHRQTGVSLEIRILGGKEFLVSMEPTSNRTATASVEDSMIRIRIPKHWPKAEGEKAFLRLQKRIFRKLEKNPLQFSRPKPLRFKDGQEVAIFGRRFVVRKQDIAGRKNSSARLKGDEVIVRLASGLSAQKEEQIMSNLARRTIANAILNDVGQFVHMLNEKHFQGKLRKVFIKENKTNFGSCSRKGNINLSFRVLLAPREILNYLVIHELAHLKEHNHSSAFWALVEKAMPDYREHREWLKNNGNRLQLGAGNSFSAMTNEIKTNEPQRPATLESPQPI